MHLVIRHGPSFISVIVKRLPVRFILHFRNFMNVKRKGAPVQFSAFHPISPSKISFPLLPLIGPYVKPQTCCTAAAAKSLQSCPTLCDPIDGSPQAPPSLGFSRQEHWSGLPFPSLSDSMDCGPPGSPVHGVFQAKELEWDAIAFSNAGK